MKLTDPNAIKTGEQKLIDLIVEKMNWKAVREAVQRHFSIEVLKDIAVDDGEMVIINNEIAYRINLGPQTGVAVIIDRTGKLLEISAAHSPDEIREKLAKTDDEISEEQTAIEDASAIASELSEMITKINRASRQGDSKSAE